MSLNVYLTILLLNELVHIARLLFTHFTSTYSYHLEQTISMAANFNRKLLFSNLSYKTTEQTLLDYFSIYGVIEELCLYKDDQDQSLRHGFLTYQDIHSLNQCMYKRPHFLDSRQMHIQRSIPSQSRNDNNLSEFLGSNLTVHEIFISRLSAGETRQTFVDYFQSYGTIVDCRVFNSSCLPNSKQTGYAFLRFADYDSVDQIILSRPHVIKSRFYHIRKCIPREYNYIISSVKPISQNRPIWRHFSFGLINTKTQEITYPSLPTVRYNKPQTASNDFTLIDPPVLTVSVDRDTRKNSSTHEFEIITTNSLSSSSISIINSTEDFTPLASPLYSTAIAYSPTTYDNSDRQIYDLIHDSQ